MQYGIHHRADHLFDLDADELRRTIDMTFAGRASHQPPCVVPRPPDQWWAPFGQLARTVGIADDLLAGHGAVAAMLDPLLDHRVQTGTWNPDLHRWTDLGG